MRRHSAARWAALALCGLGLAAALSAVALAAETVPEAAHPAAQPAGASASPNARAALGAIVVQHGGRHKPFDSFARETLQEITGAPKVGRAHPVDTVLSMLATPEHWHEVRLISIPFRPLRQALGMDLKATHVSYHELTAGRTLMRQLPLVIQKQQRDEKLSMLEQEMLDAFQRFASLSALFEHKLDLVPPPSGAIQASWLPVLQPWGYPPEQQEAIRAAWTGLLDAARGSSPQAIEAPAARLADLLARANPAAYPPAWRIRLELFYNRLRPFRAAQWLYWLAFAALLLHLRLGRRQAAVFGLAALLAGCALHAAGIALRVTLGGRPPVSNFYETLLWLPFVAIVTALVFQRVYRAQYFGLTAAFVGGLTLWVADHVPLDSSIAPVVAVLRSTLWLTIHVLTIVASYGVLALATALAHVYGVLYLARGPRHAALPALDLFMYRALQVGVVLLAGGIMLGAVWANASWGRYWGWDPKETWSLITLLWFLAVLHGRFAGWIKGAGVALATIGGFFLLLMTYYGVSFYLVGLHSYAGGHAKPLPALLCAYLVLEGCFLLLLGLTAVRRRASL